MAEKPRTRRRVLELGGAALVVGFAGCSDVVSTEEDDPSSTESTDDPAEADDSGETGTESSDGSESGDDGADEGPGGNETDGDGNEDAGADEESGSGEADAIEEPAGRYADVPIPDDPGSYEFPVAGSGDAPVTVQLFGGWKCPYTRQFVLGAFEDLVDDYVREGTVDVEFHGVAYRDGRKLHGDDGPRAARAGLAVWNERPEAFWSYLEYAFANVEVGDGWATADRLEAVAEASGIEDAGFVGEAVEAGEFESRLRETMDLVEELSVNTVPQVGVEGDSYPPTADRDSAFAAIEEAVESATDG